MTWASSSRSGCTPGLADRQSLQERCSKGMAMGLVSNKLRSDRACAASGTGHGGVDRAHGTAGLAAGAPVAVMAMISNAAMTEPENVLLGPSVL